MVSALKHLTSRMVAIALLCQILGCHKGGDTIVSIALINSTPVPEQDTHYELFASLNGGVVSVKKFDIIENDIGDGLLTEKAVIDHLRPNVQLGVVDGIELTLRPVSGIRFEVDLDLTGATDVFVTVEANSDTDPVPSQDVMMGCNFSERKIKAKVSGKVVTKQAQPGTRISSNDVLFSVKPNGSTDGELSTVKSAQSGVLLELRVEAGDAIAEGDIVATINPDPSRGTLSCLFEDTKDEKQILGSITLVPPNNEINGL